MAMFGNGRRPKKDPFACAEAEVGAAMVDIVPRQIATGLALITVKIPKDFVFWQSRWKNSPGGEKT